MVFGNIFMVHSTLFDRLVGWFFLFKFNLKFSICTSQVLREFFVVFRYVFCLFTSMPLTGQRDSSRSNCSRQHGYISEVTLVKGA